MPTKWDATGALVDTASGRRILSAAEQTAIEEQARRNRRRRTNAKLKRASAKGTMVLAAVPAIAQICPSRKYG